MGEDIIRLGFFVSFLEAGEEWRRSRKRQIRGESVIMCVRED